jgi:aldose 1-epimerase
MTGAPSGEQFVLVDGELRAVVVEVGAGLRALTMDDRNLIDGYDEDAMADGARGQLLAPWPNRTADGRYGFDGVQHQLPLTDVSGHNAIHGLVRWQAWRLVGSGDGHAVLEHEIHPQPGYPFQLHLQVDYRLSDGLKVTTTCTNVGPTAAPYGLGAHPYLSAGGGHVDQLVLTVPASTVLESDERGIPLRRGPVAGTPYDFRGPRPIGDLVLDHAFTGLSRGTDGTARVLLTDPADGVVTELSVDETFGHLMVFSGDTLAEGRRRRGLAIEPMTCPPNALATGEDVIRLEPGASTTSTWRIRAWRS